MKQARERSKIRLEQGRGTLLDYVVRNLSIDDDPEEGEDIEERFKSFEIDDQFFIRPEDIFLV